MTKELLMLLHLDQHLLLLQLVTGIITAGKRLTRDQAGRAKHRAAVAVTAVV